MWPFKKKKKVEIVGNPVEINPPSKSPKAIARNDQRIRAIMAALEKSKCVGEVREQFESELRRRNALKTFWENK
jgi:hypothetical protein